MRGDFSMSLTEQLVNFNKNNNNFDNIYLLFKKRIDFLILSFHIESYKNDLTLFLWQLLKKIQIDNFSSEKALYSYINVSLKNHCMNIYRKISKEKITFNSELTDIEIDKSTSYNPIDNSSIIFDDLIASLSDHQKQIITMRYKYCLSDSEIASSLNISRQAVYKNRKLALSKLQKSYII